MPGLRSHRMKHRIHALLTTHPHLTVSAAIVAASLLLIAYLELSHQRGLPSPEAAMRRIVYGVR